MLYRALFSQLSSLYNTEVTAGTSESFMLILKSRDDELEAQKRCLGVVLWCKRSLLSLLFLVRLSNLGMYVVSCVCPSCRPA